MLFLDCGILDKYCISFKRSFFNKSFHMGTPGGHTVLVFVTIAIQNSISLIIDSREFNQRKRQLQRKRHLKIVLVVMISSPVFQHFK